METLAGEGLAPTELIVTPVRVTVVLPEADTDAAVRAAHARLVG